MANDEWSEPDWHLNDEGMTKSEQYARLIFSSFELRH